jgi:hypothetical protein
LNLNHKLGLARLQIVEGSSDVADAVAKVFQLRVYGLRFEFAIARSGSVCGSACA